MLKDNPVLKIFIIIILFVLGIVAVFLLQNIVPDITGERSTKDDNSKAVIRCEEVIKASLRSVDGAKLTSQKVVALGQNRYQVTGNVDAQNATGIIVRGNYNCVFNFDTKSFDLLSLEGDDVWKPLKK